MQSNYSLKYKSGKSGWKQFFLHNKNALLRKFNPNLELPWMKQKEIEVLWEILKNRNPKNSLEWGCGYSTLYFPTLLAGEFEWTSIEHVKEWAEIVQAKNSRKEVEVKYVAAELEETKGEGTFDEYKSYVQWPQVKAPFDFILIDGRARKHCLVKAFEMIADDGVVVVHDANRKSYLDNTSLFANQLLFVDYRRTAGGLWIGSKTLPLTKSSISIITRRLGVFRQKLAGS